MLSSASCRESFNLCDYIIFHFTNPLTLIIFLDVIYLTSMIFKTILFFLLLSLRFSHGQPSALALQPQRTPLPVALLPDVDPQPAGPGHVAPAKPHPERGGQQCQARGGGGGQEEGTLLTCHPSTPPLRLTTPLEITEPRFFCCL